MIDNETVPSTGGQTDKGNHYALLSTSLKKKKQKSDFQQYQDDT